MNAPVNFTDPAKSNNDFIRKASSTVSTFSPGGVLLPQQAAKFVELAIVKSSLLQDCNTQIIPTSTYEVDKMGFTGQVLHPDEEDTAFGSADVASPETGKTTLVSKRYKAEIGLTYDTVKRVINGDQLMPYLLNLAAEAARRDVEKCALLGDTSLSSATSLNRLLKKQDGFLKLITSSVVDAAGARMNLNLLDEARRLMPAEYFDEEGLEFLMSKNGEIDYQAAVTARATVLGDQNFAARNATAYHQHKVRRVPLLPTTLTYNGADKHSTALFCNPGTQLMVGFLEEMNVRTAEDIRAGKFIAVIRFDVAFQVLHQQACVKITNIRDLT